MYGFLAGAHKTIKDMKEQGSRDVMEFVFLKGVSALTTTEIAEKSIKWLKDTVVPSYIAHLKNKNDSASTDFLDNLYAADHIRCIL